MADRELPNLGLKGFWLLGEDGWNTDHDLNLLKLSVLVQAGAISKVSATPGSPSEGDVYLFSETHPTQPNAIAIYDDGAWVYVSPNVGWLVYNEGAGYYETFDGSAWGELATGGAAAIADLTDVDLAGLADGQVLIWNATTNMWEPGDVSTGGGGGSGSGDPSNLVFLGEAVAVGGETVLSFTGINQAYEDLILTTSFNTQGSTLGFGQMTFNGDSAANYDHVGSATSTAASHLPMNYGFPAATSGSYFTSVEITVADYAKTDRWKLARAWGMQQNAASTTTDVEVRIVGKWRSTAAINRVDFTLNAGTFSAGSRIRLYARAKIASGGSTGGGGAVLTQVGTAYTAQLSDENNYIRFTNGSAVTFTIPANATVAFPVGTVIEFEQAGAGALTIAAAAGVTIDSRAADYTLAGQYATGFVKKVDVNTWTLGGDL